ncbi:MAG TPA: cytochrome c biogenesis protein CcsA [Candidatus Acidoferrales bacterium]
MGKRTWNLAGALLPAITAALLLIAFYVVFLEVPTERTMGVIQRIFYVHVPSAWISFFAFFVVFVSSLAYLATGQARWDWAAVSAAEIGLVYCSIVLTTGPLWAKPVWGIWWTWDARLTSTLVLFMIYVAYLLLRNAVSDPSRRANLAAAVGIIGFLDVPIVYMSIRWWRTQHPQPVIAGGAGSGLDPEMWRGFLWCLAAFLSLFAWYFRERYRMERMRAELESLQREMSARP